MHENWNFKGILKRLSYSELESAQATNGILKQALVGVESCKQILIIEK